MTRRIPLQSLRHILILLTIAAAPLVSYGQKGSRLAALSPLPSGMTLPVRLAHELKAGSTKTGEIFQVTTTQRILITANSYLPEGTAITGTVVASQPSASASIPSVLSIRFKEIHYKGQTLPIHVKALALANFVQVMDASVIASGATDRGNPDPANWTTNQVGGDQVYRSGWIGNVYSSYSHKVGFADYHGVYALPAQQGALPRALGVFSSNCAGLYGFGNTARLTETAPDLTITDLGQRVVLRKGDDLLLEVTPETEGK